MGKITFREGSFGFFAEMDLQDMEATLSARVGTPRGCCLYAQQLIEKMFKQLRMEQGCKPGHPDLTGHHLLHLAEVTQFPDREKYRQELLSLGKVYFEGRYPPEGSYYMFIMPTWQEAETAAALARFVYNWVVDEILDIQQRGRAGVKRMNLGNSK